MFNARWQFRTRDKQYDSFAQRHFNNYRQLSFWFLSTDAFIYTFVGPLDKNSTDLDFRMSMSMLGDVYAETSYAPMYSYSTYNNSPFFRDEADLLVFMFSDEDDQSNITSQDFHDWITTKWPDKIVDVVAIVPTDESCGLIHIKYTELETIFGHQLINLCSEGWDEWLSHSSFLTTFLDHIVLTQIPRVNSIAVYVDHIQIDEWYFDALTNTIYLNDVPAQGSLVEVGYNII